MKIYAILVGLILSLSIGLYYSLSGLFTARSELKATNALLIKANARNKALEAFTVAVQDQVKKTYQESGKSRQGLEHALSKETDWSAKPVPDGIANELCASLTCSTTKTH